MFMDLVGMPIWPQGVEIGLGALPWWTATLHHRIFSFIHWPILFEVYGLGLFPSLVCFCCNVLEACSLLYQFVDFKTYWGREIVTLWLHSASATLEVLPSLFLAWFPLKVIFLLPNSLPYSPSVFFLVFLPIPIKTFSKVILYSSLSSLFHSPPM